MPTPVTRESLRRVLAEHGPALALYASQWCDTPEDCVQEALVELAALPRAPDRVEAWMYRRVRQRALNAARARRRRRDHETEAWRERLTAVDGVDDSAAAFDLLEALAALPNEQRELVMLRFWSDLSFAEIARVVGCSSSAAHRRMEQALDHLRTRLESPCETRSPTR